MPVAGWRPTHPNDCRTLRATAWVAATICAAVWLAGCRSEQSRNCHVSARDARSDLVLALRDSDTLEVYTKVWPGEKGQDRMVAVLSRKSDPKRWEAYIEAADQARPREMHQSSPYLLLRLRSEGRLMAMGWADPGAKEVGLFLPKNRLAALTVPPVLVSTFQPYYDQVSRALSGSPDAPKHQKETTDLSSAPFPSFGEVKARMVKLFYDCEYANICLPGRGSIGINTQEEGKDAWDLMTLGVEEAEAGRAIVGEAELVLLCETREQPGYLIQLQYVGGYLGASDRDLGGNIRTLKPSPAFREGLEQLRVVAEERQRCEQRER